MREVLKVESLSKVFFRKKGIFRKEPFYALRDVSFSLGEGEILGLVGESGSGKSTIAKIIVRLEKPTEGSVYLMGKEARSFGKEYTKYVSIVFQDPRTSLNPRMKVKDIISEPLEVHRVPNKEERVRDLLKKVHLSEELAQRKPEDLSGGQRQRVAIARALALNPKVVVADEPTASLDASVRVGILELFLNLKEDGISTLLITHDMRVIERVADRVGVLYGGRLFELGNKEEVLNSPMHPYTKFLLSSVPVKHPKDRKPVDLEEAPQSIPQEGCPFVPRCSEAKSECEYTLRRVRIDGRIVQCNLY